MAIGQDEVPRHFHSPRDYLEAARSPESTSALLATLAHAPFEFVQLAVAENVNTPAATLLGLVPRQLGSWDSFALVRTIIEHPAADEEVRVAAKRAIEQALSEGKRPYAAGIALAGRDGLDHDDVSTWAKLPGSSSRFITGLRRARKGRDASRA